MPPTSQNRERETAQWSTDLITKYPIIPMKPDPAEERLQKIERYINCLRDYLQRTLEQNYALAAEVAALKGVKQDQDITCTKILKEYNALNTLRPIKREPNR